MLFGANWKTNVESKIHITSYNFQLALSVSIRIWHIFLYHWLVIIIIITYIIVTRIEGGAGKRLFFFFAGRNHVSRYSTE